MLSAKEEVDKWESQQGMGGISYREGEENSEDIREYLVGERDSIAWQVCIRSCAPDCITCLNCAYGDRGLRGKALGAGAA